MKPLAWAAALLGAAACQQRAEPAASPAPPPAIRAADLAAAGAVPLRFAWPAQGAVQVRETVRKKGHTAVFEYELRWRPRAAGGCDAAFGALRCTSMDGAALTAEAAARFLQSAGLGESGLPSLRVDADGQLAALLDLEAWVESALTAMLRGSSADAAERARLLATMRSPEALALVQERAAQTWNCWVGAWVGAAVDVGATREARLAAPVGGAPNVPVNVRFSAAADEQDASLLRLTLDGEFDAAALGAALGQNGRIEREDRFEVLTDPASLMPRKALRRFEVRVYDAAGTLQGTQKEQHLYAFAWQPGESD